VRLMPLYHRVITSNTAIWYSVECYLPRFTSKNKTSHSHGRFRCWLHKAQVSPSPPPSYKKQKNRPLGRFRYWLNGAQASKYRLRIIAPALKTQSCQILHQCISHFSTGPGRLDLITSKTGVLLVTYYYTHFYENVNPQRAVLWLFPNNSGKNCDSVDNDGCL